MQLPDDLITPSEAARLRGTSLEALRQLIIRGRISSYVVAGRRLVRSRDVENLIPLKPGPKTGTQKGKK